MIQSSVGRAGKAANAPNDVKVIQRAFNRYLKPVNQAICAVQQLVSGTGLASLKQCADTPLGFTVDGRVTDGLVAAIEMVQKDWAKVPVDGVVSPNHSTIKALCPVRFATPTTLGLRTHDSQGAGHFGAPRGSRSHQGQDYKSQPGNVVVASMSGVVVRNVPPYAPNPRTDSFNFGVDIEASDKTICRAFYIRITKSIGDVVWAGDPLGIALKQSHVRPGMTEHIHIAIIRNGRKVDPTTLIR